MHFVLDQNFPIQVTGLPWPPTITISPLKSIDPELTYDHEDWELFRALSKLGDVDGFITNDASILNLSREMVMLGYTQLTLIVTADCGGDPLGATGLLMLHLPQIAKQNHPKPRIYVLSRPRLQLKKVRPQIDILAQRAKIPARELMSQELEEIRRVPE